MILLQLYNIVFCHMVSQYTFFFFVRFQGLLNGLKYYLRYLWHFLLMKDKSNTFYESVKMAETQVGGGICEEQGSQPISVLHRQLKMFLLRSVNKKAGCVSRVQ